MHCSCIEVSD
uniref:Uncharacterized protein n=1 Tax=Anguilla anguilla TaxID=7936 RepID=A0A0E9Y129_ANGAN